MAAGVKIYEYEPGFIHAKSYLADMEDTFAKSIEITPDMLKTNLMQKLIRAVVKIFAPMM